MNIVMITENDPAGMGIAFANAINEHTEHSCRLVTTKTRYHFEFEKDIHVPDLDEEGIDEIVSLLNRADIIHFHILADEQIRLGPIKVKDYISGKALLNHHHGHPDFRSNPHKYREKYRALGRKVLVSTPDLLKLVPEATWQPNLVPIEAPLYRPLQSAGNGKVRICQSPTRKDLKNTSAFLAVMEVIRRSYRDLETVILDDTLHSKCLEIKQLCDIHFDHLQGYYGVSSLEGLSQGKPVIAGLDEWNIKHIRAFTGRNELPWVIVRDKDGLEDNLRELVTDDSRRKRIGEKSRHFMENSWTEEYILQRLFAVYERL